MTAVPKHATTVRLPRKGAFQIPMTVLAVLLSLFLLSPVVSRGDEAEQGRLLEEVQTFYQQRKYSEGVAAAEKLLELTVQLQGDDHIETAVSGSWLAELYRVQGRYNEAEPFFRRSLEIYEKQMGADHPGTATALSNLAGLYQSQGRHGDAEPLWRRSLQIREKHWGEDHLHTAASLDNLAGLYRTQGRYNEAEPLSRRSLDIYENQLGTEHSSTATALDNLAKLYQDQGRYREAEPLFRSSLAIVERQLGTDHPGTAAVLNNLALLHQNQGRYGEAELLYRRSLDIAERQLGKEHSDTATVLNGLAGLYHSQGRYGDAEPLFRRSLEIREKQLGANHPDTAASLESLALLYHYQGFYGEAELLYRRSLEIYEKELGVDHLDTASPLNYLAELYVRQGRYEEAEPLFRRSLDIAERQLGKEHPDTVYCLSCLAMLYRAQGRYNEAEPLFRRSLEICAKQMGADHPYTATALYNLASLYQAQGRYGEAEPLLERGIQSTVAHWRGMLAYFSERECLEFQRSQYPLNPSGNQGSGRLAAEAQLFFKGAVVEAMNARRVAEDQLVQSEKGRELLQQREALRPRYQKAVLELGAANDETKSLQQQLEDLDKQAATLIGDSTTAEALLSVGLEPVRQTLPENARLVETFRYHHRVDPKTWEPRYASTLISPTDDPAFLSHGDAESIEAAIRTYRSLLDGSRTDATPEALREAETTLYTRLLAPLEEHLSPGQTVIFSPDAQLHFIPLGLLRDADGKAFAEKYQVRYVSSGRDLVKEVPQRKTTGLKAFALGNPTYRDNAPLLALAEAEEDANQNALASNLRAGMGQDSGSIQFRPLPGTAREVGSLSTLLQNSGYQVATLSGKEATEAAVKQGMAGHDLIHLATHGFFLNELKTSADDADALIRLGQDDPRPKGPVQNPMFRSGLALAGAQSTFNLWKSGQIPPPASDGVLLAAELTGIDLRGTDLVVLSACETAAGESLDGEGVMGLRRALNAAGATNVVMTLWPVDDAATVEVMEVFYQKYLSGIPAAKAMAETQRELLPQWVEQHGEIKALSRLAPFLCTSLGPVE